MACIEPQVKCAAGMGMRLCMTVLMGWFIHSTAMCVVRRSNNTFGDRCFASAGPRLWNTLPAHLRQCDSLRQFKRLLKTHLFGSWDRGALWHFCYRSVVYKSSYLLTTPYAHWSLSAWCHGPAGRTEVTMDVARDVGQHLCQQSQTLSCKRDSMQTVNSCTHTLLKITRIITYMILGSTRPTIPKRHRYRICRFTAVHSRYQRTDRHARTEWRRYWTGKYISGKKRLFLVYTLPLNQTDWLLEVHLITGMAALCDALIEILGFSSWQALIALSWCGRPPTFYRLLDVFYLFVCLFIYLFMPRLMSRRTIRIHSSYLWPFDLDLLHVHGSWP